MRLSSLVSARSHVFFRLERLAALLLVGALLSACAAEATRPAASPIAKIERVDGTITRITLTAKAVERIGIETAPVRAAAGGRVIPYGALIYDTKGDTFTYTNPSALVYMRHSVRVADIRGDQVVLADGPAAGATVVSVGGSQLLGIELGIGS